MVTAFKGIATALMIMQLACVLWFHMTAIEHANDTKAAEIGFAIMELTDAAALFAIWMRR